MAADTSLFRLEQTSPRLGETLRVGLEFPEGAPWLKAVARVGVRLEGWVEYRGRDGEHLRRALPGSAEASREGALTGTPRLSFTVTVPDDVPPSHVSDQARVEWVLIASLSDAQGAVLHEETRPLRLLPRRTHQHPVRRDPPVPQSPEKYVKGISVGLMLLPLLCCILPGMGSLLGLLMGLGTQARGPRTVLMLGAAALVVAGAVVLANMLGANSSVMRVRVLQLEPLAEGFPLGTTARLRLYLELSESLTVTEAELRLGTGLHANQSSRELLSRRVGLSLPRHLASGWHTFDVEVPIPQDFIPGYRELLKPSCTVHLHTEEVPEGVHCTASLRILPEVLDA